MYDQGSSFSTQSGQGPRAPMPPPTYLQRPPPAIARLFQQGPMLQPPPVNVPTHHGQQGMPLYPGQSPMRLNFGVRPGGTPLPGFGGASLPNMYPPAQLGTQQHYFAGPPPPPPPPPPLPPVVRGSHRPEMMQPSLPPRGLPPPPPQGHVQLQVQQLVAQSVNLPPPPPLLPPPPPPSSSSPVVSNCASESLMTSKMGNSQMTMVANPSSLPQPPSSSPPPEQSSLLPPVAAGPPAEQADSDMEMEDDITQFEDELSANLNKVENASRSLGFTGGYFETKEPSHVPGTSCKNGGPISPLKKLCEQGAAVSIDSDQNSTQVVKGGSPIRLLQDYVSDDSSESYENPCMRVANHQTISSANSAEIFQESTRLNLETNSVSPSLQITDRGNCHRSLELQTEPEKPALLFQGSGADSKHVDGNKGSVSHVTCHQPSIKEDPSSNEAIRLDLAFRSPVTDEEKIENFASDSRKIDDFGRLVREGSSDNESADSGYARRRSGRGKNHSRSPSGSRSPQERRWRRRGSPRRRREKRSRSRSWSPRKRRNRSRSPLFRRAEFNTSTARRGEGQLRDCFDFLRGKCYRGSFCRYLHHDYEKNDGPRSHRNKQQYPESSQSRNTSTDEEIKRISVEVCDCKQEFLNREEQLGQDMFAVSDTKESSIVYNEEGSASHPMKCASSIEVGKLADVDAIKPEVVRGAIAVALQTKVVHGEPEISRTDVDCIPVEETKSHIGDVNILKFHVGASQDVASTSKDSAIPKCQSDLSSDKYLGTSPKKHYIGGAFPSSEDTTCIPPRALSPSSAPLVEAANASLVVQLGKDQNLIAQTAAFEPQHFPLGNASVLLNQNSLFPLPTDTASPSLPLPPPPPILSSSYRTVDNGGALHGHPLQFQQAHLPLVNDGSSQMFFRPYPTEFHGHSQGFSASDSLTLTKNFPPSLPLHEMNAVKVSSFPASIVSPGGNLAPSFPGQLYSQQQAGILSQPVSHDFKSVPGKVSSFMAQFDIVEPNQAPCLHDLSLPRRSAHYNPYASTFEKPLSSRFSTDVLRQENNALFSSKLDQHLNFSHPSNDGLIDGSVGTRQLTSSPKSGRHFGQIISASRDDQYDPLFDSIDPSLDKIKKHDRTRKWDNDSDNMLRHSTKPLDVEENNKKKEIGGVAVTISLDDEEFGETADAEVGDVENASQSNPNEPIGEKMGEMEIGQSISPGGQKKTKDSRSMKLFKVALADFVKEVLKPSWRQGNMSKEAFKTVVKKTVDKVSGAMKGHRIPKSKAKINQYIESSQRKLTKLVMGYVDKYAKG